MNRTLALLVAQFVVIGSSAAPLGTAFTYNGHLSASGNPATGLYEFRFVLYDAEIGGSQVGNILTNLNVAVTNGVFTTTLDFGTNVFDGDALWLELAVRPGGSPDPFDPLAPRQPMTPTPYSLFALAAGRASTAETLPWSRLTGVPEGFADNVDNNTTYSAGTGLTLGGTVFSIANGGVGSPQLANGAVVERVLAAGAVTAFAIADGAVTEVKVSNSAVSTAKLMDSSVTDRKLDIAAVTEAKIADGAVTTAKLGDEAVTERKLADGAVSSTKLTSMIQLNQLNLYSPFTESISLELSGLGRHVRGFGPDGLEDFTLDAAGHGALTLRDEADNNITAELSATGNGGGRLGLRSPGGSTRVSLNATAAPGNDGAYLLFLGSSPNSRLELFANAPSLALQNPTPTDGGGIDLHDANNVRRVALRAGGGQVSGSGADGLEDFLLDAIGHGRLLLRDADGNDTAVELNATANSGGHLSLQGPDGGLRIRLDAASGLFANDGAYLHFLGGAGTPSSRLELFANAPALVGQTLTDGGGIDLHDANNVRRVALRAGGGRMDLFAGDGTATARLQAGAGDATLTGGGILQLGPIDGGNLVFDGNEILARNNALQSTLYLNATGGRVVIGTNQGAAGYQLSVNGSVICSELVVQEPGDWPDYVFADDYALMPLEQLEASIREHRHLPGVPSASEVRANGISLGEVQARLLEKIEELTLYVLEQNRRLKLQEAELAALRTRLEPAKSPIDHTR